MRKLRLLTLLVVIGSLLAALAIGPAQAKKRSCKNKKEENGCKLKDGAGYVGLLAGGGSTGLFVEKSSWYANVIGGDSNGCSRRRSRYQITFRGRPKVGKSYTLTANSRKNQDGILVTTRISGKVKIDSAKKATFSGTFFSQGQFRDNLSAPCQKSLNVTAKRDR